MTTALLCILAFEMNDHSENWRWIKVFFSLLGASDLLNGDDSKISPWVDWLYSLLSRFLLPVLWLHLFTCYCQCQFQATQTFAHQVKVVPFSLIWLGEVWCGVWRSSKIVLHYLAKKLNQIAMQSDKALLLPITYMQAHSSNRTIPLLYSHSHPHRGHVCLNAA